MTFNDLKFEPHQIAKNSQKVKDSPLPFHQKMVSDYKNAIQATHTFSNGYGISVIGGAPGFHGDGVNNFEVAVLCRDRICYSTPIADDVIGWQSRSDIDRILSEIEALPEAGD